MCCVFRKIWDHLSKPQRNVHAWKCNNRIVKNAHLEMCDSVCVCMHVYDKRLIVQYCILLFQYHMSVHMCI